MYQMKKGGSSKKSKQQAAIAIAMKAAGKKPKMQSGGEKPKPTYKNLNMGVRNEQYQMSGQYKDVTPSALDSANYRRGYERGLKGGKEFPNEGNVEKMGRWEGQNVGKKKLSKNAKGGSVGTSKMKMGGAVKKSSKKK